MTISLPDQAIRRVRVEYRDWNGHPIEQLGVLAPDEQGRQTLCIHLHLARQGVPTIERVTDLESGEVIRVSASWLGNGGFYD